METRESKQSTEMRHMNRLRASRRHLRERYLTSLRSSQTWLNPFIEESLDTRDIMDEVAAKSVRRAEELGVQQYQAFDVERLVNCSKLLSDPIKNNKLQLFGQPPARDKCKSKLQSIKSDCSLFFRLCIACQSRDGDLHDFFRHENQGPHS